MSPTRHLARGSATAICAHCDILHRCPAAFCACECAGGCLSSSSCDPAGVAGPQLERYLFKQHHRRSGDMLASTSWCALLSLQAQPLRQRLLLLLLYTHHDAHMRERRACNTLQSQLLSIRSAGLGLATRPLKRCLHFDRNHHMLTLQQQQSMLNPTTNMSTAQGVTAPPHSKQHTHTACMTSNTHQQ